MGRRFTKGTYLYLIVIDNQVSQYAKGMSRLTPNSKTIIFIYIVVINYNKRDERSGSMNVESDEEGRSFRPSNAYSIDIFDDYCIGLSPPSNSFNESNDLKQK
jgi:hypothetical protein